MPRGTCSPMPRGTCSPNAAGHLFPNAAGDEMFSKWRQDHDRSASASHDDWPRVTDDDRPGMEIIQHAKGSPKSKRHRNRQARKKIERDRRMDEAIVMHMTRATAELAVLMMAAGIATQQAPEVVMEQEIMVVSEDKTKKRKTWAARVKEAKDKVTSMFQVHRGFTVDSGAADHVIPRGWIGFVEIVESIGSRMGVTYVAANGSRISN